MANGKDGAKVGSVLVSTMDPATKDIESFSLSQLRKHAMQIGANEDELEAMLDSDDPRQALIAAITEHTNQARGVQ